MTVLHVQRCGAHVSVSGDELIVQHDGRVTARAQLPLLQAVVLHGAVSLEGALVARLLDAGIDCVFLSFSGRFLGRLESARSDSGTLRALQAIAASSRAYRLPVARAIVRNKITSQQRTAGVLLRGDASGVPALLARLADEVPSCRDRSALLGCEGLASRAYFGLLAGRMGLRTGWTRQHRPARDGANALLNYGYAILRGRVHNAVGAAGLDPSLGFLHAPGRPRPAFVLDMMEEFRAPVVDLACLYVLRRLGEVGWYERIDGDVRLAEAARRLLIANVERRFQARVRYRPSGVRVTIAGAITRQVQAMASTFRAGPRSYRPAW